MGKFTKLITPAGSAIWPALGKANTKFNPDGVFELKLAFNRFDPAVTEFVEKIDALRAEALDHIRKEYEDKNTPASKAAIKRMTQAPSPIKPIFDKDGEETDQISVQGKLKALFKRLDGSMGTHEFVRCMDAKKNPIDPRTVAIGSGSKCKMLISVYPYVVPLLMQVGVAIRLEAVQVLELSAYSSGGVDFDEEDGFVTSASAPKAPAPVVAEEEDEDSGDF